MDNTKLSDIIKTFIENNNYKCILIDGPWGCGKTYEINKYIKENIKKLKKVHYISLFGLESVDEINTAVYYETHKCKMKLFSFGRPLFKSVGLISKAVPAINQLSNITDALDFQLEGAAKKIKKNRIIIFDDLERIGSSLDYISLLGYFNKLFLSGCRIISCISSENLPKESSFTNFKEKVFDCVYVINETNNEIFNSIFKKYNISDIESTYELFNNNIRFANKVSLFYEQVINLFEKNDVSIKNAKHAETLIFIAAIYTVIISLKSFSDNNIKVDDSFRYNVEKFGKDIAIGLKKSFDKKDYNQRIISNIVEKMLDFFLFKDDTPLREYFFSKVTKKETTILDNEFYFLSDKEKEEYFHYLENHISNSDFNLKDVRNNISSIIRYSNFDFSNKSLKKIAEKYYEINNLEYNLIAFDFNLDDDNGRNKTRVDKFIAKIKIELEKCAKEKLEKQIDELKQTNNYNALYTFFENIMHKSINNGIDAINKVLIDNQFFMPQLDQKITEIEWRYSHLIAEYSVRYKLEQEFIKLAKEKCKGKDEKSTIVDRYNTLIIYKIDFQFEIDDLIK